MPCLSCASGSQLCGGILWVGSLPGVPRVPASGSSSSGTPKKELQQRVVFQQHAALIGGPNATSCPVCHKLFLGGEALMEHMKHTHKDPNASGVASKYRNDTTDKQCRDYGVSLYVSLFLPHILLINCLLVVFFYLLGIGFHPNYLTSLLQFHIFYFTSTFLYCYFLVHTYYVILFTLSFRTDHVRNEFIIVLFFLCFSLSSLFIAFFLTFLKLTSYIHRCLFKFIDSFLRVHCDQFGWVFVGMLLTLSYAISGWKTVKR